MKTLLFISCLFVSTVCFSQMKQPPYFLSQLPNFPVNTAQYKQMRDRLGNLIREAAGEINKYNEATEELTPDDSGPEKTTRRFHMQNAALAQRNRMLKKKEEDEYNEMVTKSNQFVTDFERLQMEYKKEILEKITPLDVKIIKLNRDAKKSSPDLAKAKSERSSAFDAIAKKYLTTADAKFPIFLKEYLDYLKNTTIPVTEKSDAVKFESLKLPFKPCGGSLDVLKTYMTCLQRASDNYNDLKE